MGLLRLTTRHARSTRVVFSLQGSLKTCSQIKNPPGLGAGGGGVELDDALHRLEEFGEDVEAGRRQSSPTVGRQDAGDLAQARLICIRTDEFLPEWIPQNPRCGFERRTIRERVEEDDVPVHSVDHVEKSDSGESHSYRRGMPLCAGMRLCAFHARVDVVRTTEGETRFAQRVRCCVWSIVRHESTELPVRSFVYECRMGHDASVDDRDPGMHQTRCPLVCDDRFPVRRILEIFVGEDERTASVCPDDAREFCELFRPRGNGEWDLA